MRIVRVLDSWPTDAFEPLRMSAADVGSAPASIPLSARSAAAIRADLAARPRALLADSLRAMVELGRWVEQEAFLGRGG